MSDLSNNTIEMHILTLNAIEKKARSINQNEQIDICSSLIAARAKIVALEAQLAELEAVYKRCWFPPSTDNDNTWCLALLQDGHITLNKAREWLGEHLRGGIAGPLPTAQQVGPSIWTERDTALSQLAAAEQQVRVAAGMLSTHPQFSDKHPEVALKAIQDATIAAQPVKL